MDLAESTIKKFRCLSCQSTTLNRTNESLGCPACGMAYPIQDGMIHMFKRNRDILGQHAPKKKRRIFHWLGSKPVVSVYEKFWRTIGLSLIANGGKLGWEREMTLFHRFCRLKQVNSAMDLCCGPGNTTREVARVLANGGGDQVLGVDLSMNMLEKAVERNSEFLMGGATIFVRANGLSLPFNDGVFDLVTCLGLPVFRASDEKVVLSEIRRVLKNGGVLVADVAVETTTALSRFGDRLTKWMGWRVWKDIKEVEVTFIRNGFSQIEIEMWNRLGLARVVKA